MLAKLVAHGDTRDQAADRLQAALRDLAILGVPTNIDFLGRVMSNSTFRSGKLHTGFIAQEAAQLLAPQVCVREDVAAVVAALIGDTDFRTSVLDTPEPYASIGSWNN
jgi:acetyl/propionyl-CoA carboxylase alpha subunit